MMKRVIAGLSAVLRACELNQRLVADALDVIARTPDEFSRYLKSDMNEWGESE
jgi:hypothetical protein